MDGTWGDCCKRCVTRVGRFRGSAARQGTCIDCGSTSLETAFTGEPKPQAKPDRCADCATDPLRAGQARIARRRAEVPRCGPPGGTGRRSRFTACRCSPDCGRVVQARVATRRGETTE